MFRTIVTYLYLKLLGLLEPDDIVIYQEPYTIQNSYVINDNNLESGYGWYTIIH